MSLHFLCPAIQHTYDASPNPSLFLLHATWYFYSLVMCYFCVNTSVPDPGCLFGSRVRTFIHPGSQIQIQDPGSQMLNPTTATQEEREENCRPTFFVAINITN
jgi:hypothetical protein